MAKVNKEGYLTTAPKDMKMTNGGIFPKQKYVPGDSVDEHSRLEEANTLITGDEIRQQNENL